MSSKQDHHHNDAMSPCPNWACESWSPGRVGVCQPGAVLSTNILFSHQPWHESKILASYQLPQWQLPNGDYFHHSLYIHQLVLYNKSFLFSSTYLAMYLYQYRAVLFNELNLILSLFILVLNLSPKLSPIWPVGVPMSFWPIPIIL